MIRNIAIVTIALITAGCQQGSPVSDEARAAPANGIKSSAANPMVVELYQSQGCSSCPPANSALNAIAGRSDVIALNFSVTYWDRLGWKDIFGDPKYTQRQYDYASALRSSNVYTPQVILNGRRAIVGNGPGELDEAVKKTAPLTGGPSIQSAGGKAVIGSGSGTADIWLVRYDIRIHNVAIKAGENNGRTLPHRNIVRQLVKIGDWRGTAASYTLPANPSRHYRSVILVQRRNAGPIISAKRI